MQHIFIHSIPLLLAGAALQRGLLQCEEPFIILAASRLFEIPAWQTVHVLDVRNPMINYPVPGAGVVPGGFDGLSHPGPFLRAGETVCFSCPSPATFLYVLTYSEVAPSYTLGPMPVVERIGYRYLAPYGDGRIAFFYNYAEGGGSYQHRLEVPADVTDARFEELFPAGGFWPKVLPAGFKEIAI